MFSLRLTHIGYVERETYETLFGDAFDAMNAFTRGYPINMVQSEDR